MKKLFLPFVFVLIGSAAMATGPDGESGQATLDFNYCITLDADADVYDTYTIDFSTLGFTSRDEVTQVFNSITSNLISFDLDMPNRTATMILHKDRTGTTEWTKGDWIDYFDSRCND